jgi:hypothetical protein
VLRPRHRRASPPSRRCCHPPRAAPSPTPWR